ncbi:hypothetical protein [Streptomyces sp. NPDC050560]|uniref:hypothetical protein n=1 Tax=Streptomyces sp. NPDC050560 TaxID=3365630 RepID=UPI00379DB089
MDAAHDAELKKELNATLDARKELGEEYEPALVESFLGKIEQQVDGVVERRVRRRLAEQQMVAARPPDRRGRRSDDGWGERFGFGIISLIVAIPLSAIAVVNAGLAGLLVSWAGIVGINAVQAVRGAHFGERRASGGYMDRDE